MVSTVVFARYRLLLRHYDRQLLRWVADHTDPLHALLENRMTLIDGWGVSLAVAIVVYAVLFLVYSLYQSFARIAHAILQLLSYI